MVRKRDGTGIPLPDMEYSCPYEEGPLLPVKGWLYTLIAPNESMSTPETRIKKNQNSTTARTQGCATKKGGGLQEIMIDTPPLTMNCDRQYC